jgi:hypothetical protein
MRPVGVSTAIRVGSLGRRTGSRMRRHRAIPAVVGCICIHREAGSVTGRPLLLLALLSAQKVPQGGRQLANVNCNFCCSSHLYSSVYANGIRLAGGRYN